MNNDILVCEECHVNLKEEKCKCLESKPLQPIIPLQESELQEILALLEKSNSILNDE